MHPVGRVTTPEEVAKLVLFLASDAPTIHVTAISVDGGLAVMKAAV